MRKIIMTKGLPGSGKTTWAKQYQKKNPNTVRVNKDELRSMLHNSVHSKGRENFVLKMRDHVVVSALAEGHDVIIDDTNLNPIHEQAMQVYAKQFKDTVVEIKDFTDVPIGKCIENDLKRLNSVGSKVILQQYNKWLKPKPLPAPAFDPSLSTAVICDLDGTLCLFGDKNPYERDFENDEINTPVWGVLSNEVHLCPGDEYLEATTLIFVSGRKEKYRNQTLQFFEKYGLMDDKTCILLMRKDSDDRKDSIVKKEIYDEHIKGKYNIKYVLDDRNQVVELWRSLGLTCLQVADGDF